MSVIGGAHDTPVVGSVKAPGVRSSRLEFWVYGKDARQVAEDLAPLHPVDGARTAGDLYGRDLVAFDAASGEERWRVAEAWFSVNVAVAGGAVYASASYLANDPHPSVFAYDAATGAERWRAEVAPSALAQVYSPPTVVGDALYVVGSEAAGGPHALTVLDAATGAERWRVALPFTSMHGSPVVLDGAAYVVGYPAPGERGSLLALA
jgi:outer membrane protein assembly factor BamB